MGQVAKVYIFLDQPLFPGAKNWFHLSQIINKFKTISICVSFIMYTIGHFSNFQDFVADTWQLFLLHEALEITIHVSSILNDQQLLKTA